MESKFIGLRQHHVTRKLCHYCRADKRNLRSLLHCSGHVHRLQLNTWCSLFNCVFDNQKATSCPQNVFRMITTRNEVTQLHLINTLGKVLYYPMLPD
jgi:hypothetical protein